MFMGSTWADPWCSWDSDEHTAKNKIVSWEKYFVDSFYILLIVSMYGPMVDAINVQGWIHYAWNWRRKKNTHFLHNFLKIIYV